MDLLYRIGEAKRILHIVRHPEGTAFAVTSVAVSIWNSAGTAVVTAGLGTAVPGTAAVEHDLYYLWTPGTADDYTYLLSYLVGSETKALWGSVAVLPTTSKYDKYVLAIQDLLQEHTSGEDSQLLSYRDLMRAADLTVRRYSQDRPRELRTTVTLTASDWTYLLSDLATGQSPAAGWVNDFSQIVRVNYPRDTTLQSRTFLGPLDAEVDERAGEWRFVHASPSAGQTADVWWTTTHTLSHTIDTIPTVDFPSVCQWGTAEALLMLANAASHTDAPQQAAEFVSYRDKQQRYRQQAMDLKREAQAGWRKTVFSIGGAREVVYGGWW